MENPEGRAGRPIAGLRLRLTECAQRRSRRMYPATVNVRIAPEADTHRTCTGEQGNSPKSCQFTLDTDRNFASPSKLAILPRTAGKMYSHNKELPAARRHNLSSRESSAYEYKNMRFLLISRDGHVPSGDVNTVYLRVNYWNDYSYVKMFKVHVFDENGAYHDLGNIKIGFSGQIESISTYATLQETFYALPIGYFSLGTDIEYYLELTRKLYNKFRDELLISLRDVVFSQEIFMLARRERVFQTSHLMGVSINTIEGQFRRVLNGGVPITDFNFRYTLNGGRSISDISLEFDVSADSKPNTNIHEITGRNGVGKTTTLNEMISSILKPKESAGRFEKKELWFDYESISDDFFSSLVSVSFSAFDPFLPPSDQPDPSKGTRYYYVV